MRTYHIEHYLTSRGQKDLYIEWLYRLRDKHAKVAIIRRIYRIEQGNFGDHRFCCEGIWELRIDVGKGYRIYYAIQGDRIVVLLCGGDKNTQSRDIELAAHYWRDWQRRGKNEKKQTPLRSNGYAVPQRPRSGS